ncbi:MAG: helix-turn-helix transcriptional regulator [Lawsonibacter sp.]|nr:helix-turn-helix transcriptional regulator [Lawsonibacter sp.]
MDIGQTIRAYRKKRGLTQGELGRLCGMTGGAISSYENGVTVPKRRVVERLAQALDIPPEKLTQDRPLPVPEGQPQASDVLLYDGVLTVLRELYGIVEGRVILGGNGASRKYYVVKQIPGDFVLYESDIAAIVRSAKASMSPLVEYMRSVREGQA